MPTYGSTGRTTPTPRKVRKRKPAPKPNPVYKSVVGVGKQTTKGAKKARRKVVTKPAHAPKIGKAGEKAVEGAAKQTTKGAKDVRRRVRRKRQSPKKAAKRAARQSTPTKAETLAMLRRLGDRHRVGPLRTSGVGGGFDPSDVVGDLAKRGGSVALDVLEETTRPVHGLAGASLEAVKGGGYKSQQKAFVRGIKNEDKYLFSDVLKEAGAPKWLSTVGGFTLDVAADPTTYLTGGVGSVGKKLALKEGERVFTKAKAAGMSDAGAKTVARRAAKRKVAQLAKEGKDNKGIQVGIGRHRTSGKTTAAISRKLGVSKAAKRVRNSKATQTAGENLRPTFRPKGATEEAHRKVRFAARRERASSVAGQKKAQNRAVAYKKSLSKKDYERVIDALESGSLKGLPADLRKVAVQLRSDFRYMKRLERQRGIAGGDLGGAARGAATKGYFPRKPEHTLEPGAPKPKTSAANLGSSKTRKTKAKTHKELRDEDPSLFSSDVPLVFGARAAESARGVAKADYLKAVAETGRRLTPETKIDTATEAAYRVTPKAIARVDWDDALKAVERGERGYVVLNKAVAERALKSTTPKTGAVADLGRFWDRKLQGRVKTILTVPNPQYHFTNLYGDLFNAYLADTGIRSLAKSAAALKRLAKRESARRTLGKQLDPTSRGVTIGGQKVTYDNLILEAEEFGAIRTGFIGRDLPEVLDAQAKEYAESLGKGRFGRKLGDKGQAFLRTRTGRALAHPIDSIRDLSQYREDFVRLGTYIEARKKGLVPEEAAERVAKYHFDYGELTDFERGVLRRVFPFYTFTARNTPLQVESFATKPGKYAALQKVREEFAKAAGLEDGWEDKLADYEQRGLPIPIPIPGLRDSNGNPLALYPKLPAMDLGRLTLNPKEQARYIAAMVTPILKAPAEITFDYNLFWGEPLTNPDAPLVPAPNAVMDLPKPIRDMLGVKMIVDKRTGEKVPAWPAKVDYAARLTPASATGIQMGTDVRNRTGQDRWLKLIGFGTGLKIAPIDPLKAQLNDAFERRGDLYMERAELLQQGIAHDKAGDPKGRYRKVLDEIYRLNERVYRLKKKAGYKILPTTGGPKKGSGDTTLDRIDKALGSPGDSSALDRIDKALGGESSTDSLDRIDKALAR